MPWLYAEHGLIGAMLVGIPIFSIFIATLLLGIAIDNENKMGMTVASLTIVICMLILWIIVPLEFGWIMDECSCGHFNGGNVAITPQDLLRKP